jgi:hypothetical protein
MMAVFGITILMLVNKRLANLTARLRPASQPVPAPVQPRKPSPVTTAGVSRGGGGS